MQILTSYGSRSYYGLWGAFWPLCDQVQHSAVLAAYLFAIQDTPSRSEADLPGFTNSSGLLFAGTIRLVQPLGPTPDRVGNWHFTFADLFQSQCGRCPFVVFKVSFQIWGHADYHDSVCGLLSSLPRFTSAGGQSRSEKYLDRARLIPPQTSSRDLRKAKGDSETQGPLPVTRVRCLLMN